MTQGDYQVLMRFLGENMQEDRSYTIVPAEPPPEAKAGAPTRSSGDEVKVVKESAPDVQVQDSPDIAVKFSFVMQSVQLELVKGDPVMVSDGPSTRKPMPLSDRFLVGPVEQRAGEAGLAVRALHCGRAEGVRGHEARGQCGAACHGLELQAAGHATRRHQPHHQVSGELFVAMIAEKKIKNKTAGDPLN